MNPEEKNVYDALVEEYKMRADDDGIDWDESYDKFCVDLAVSIVEDVERYREQVIMDNVCLTAWPWE